MIVDGLEIISIKNLNIKILGDWLKGNLCRWEGVILASDKIVSISFLKVGEYFEWVKSGKDSEVNQEISISLFPYDSQNLDVQLSYRQGDTCQRIRLTRANNLVRPEIYERDLKLGKINLICKMNGDPEVELYGLFIPRSFVSYGRNGLWHIKGDYSNIIDTKFSEILKFKRKGAFKLE